VSCCLPVICIGVVVLPACELAVRIIRQVSVVVRYQHRTGRLQLGLQRLDFRGSVGPVKHSRTLEFIFNSELLLVPRNLLNTAIKIRNYLRRHEGLFLRKWSLLWNVNGLNTVIITPKCGNIYIYGDHLRVWAIILYVWPNDLILVLVIILYV
jgi:hypothetical protein